MPDSHQGTKGNKQESERTGVCYSWSDFLRATLIEGQTPGEAIVDILQSGTARIGGPHGDREAVFEIPLLEVIGYPVVSNKKEESPRAGIHLNVVERIR